MVTSMTGFAARSGAGLGQSWTWDMRGVNAKGLDLRVRVPDWVEGLEAALKPIAAARIARGSVQVSLRLQRDESAERQSLNTKQLDSVLANLAAIEAEAKDRDVTLGPTSGADILMMRGILEASTVADDPAALSKVLQEDFKALITAFDAMRKSEGAALEQVLMRQLGEVERLVTAASAAADERKPRVAMLLKENLARVLDGVGDADPDRVAQELALLAVKADVSEEIDRLIAHVAAARDLMAATGPVGRKLDFLMQEFNREANTLCSKSGSSALTRIGLDLKAVIDQMREQVQNVE